MKSIHQKSKGLIKNFKFSVFFKNQIWKSGLCDKIKLFRISDYFTQDDKEVLFVLL